MPKRGSEREGELRRFEPVSDELALAAVDRAEQHRRGVEREWVTLSELTEHLGFVRTGWTTRQLRPQLAALVADGLLARYRRSSRGLAERRLHLIFSSSTNAADLYGRGEATGAHAGTARPSGLESRSVLRPYISSC
jgi:hypothetical protein